MLMCYVDITLTTYVVSDVTLPCGSSVYEHMRICTSMQFAVCAN